MDLSNMSYIATIMLSEYFRTQYEDPVVSLMLDLMNGVQNILKS